MNGMKMTKCFGKTHSVVQLLLILWMTSLIHIAVGVVPVAPSGADNLGREFVFAIPPNYAGNKNAPFTIGIVVQAISTNVTSVMVNVPLRSMGFNFTLEPGSAPYDLVLSPDLATIGVARVTNATVVVRSDQDVSVTAYNIKIYTNAMFTVLPTKHMGNEYFIATLTQPSGGVVLMSAFNEPTEVKIELNGGVAFRGELHSPGSVIICTLGPYETLQLEPLHDDIIGTRITANTSITVTIGGICSIVPDGFRTCDHIATQLISFDRWGRSFLLSPFASRLSGYQFQVVAGRNNTRVSLGTREINLNMGEHYLGDIANQSMTSISATKPVMVMQYSKSKSTDGKAGDPAMLLVTPWEQYVSRVEFPVLNFTAAGISSVYIGVISECNATHNIEFGNYTYNEVHWLIEYDLITSDNRLICNRWVTIEEGSHVLKSESATQVTGAGETVFTALVYGVGERTAYLYNAGCGLQPQTCIAPSSDPPYKEMEVSCASQRRTDCSGSNPCQNGGTCENNTCTCVAGFNGVMCSTVDCSGSNPCRNGGNCENNACTCAAGLNGVLCNTVDCSGSNPCQNGGSCENNTCTCAADFNGVLCRTVDCSGRNPCQNGGTCENNACTCAAGLNGVLCRTGISRLVPVRVNPYQPSSFTCYVEGIPLPNASSVDFYRRTESTENRTGINRRSSTVSGSERAVVFDVDSVYPQEYGVYVCILYVGNTSYPSTPVNNATYVLPVIEKAPVIVTTTSTKVGIKWNAWSEEDDIGDPPLVGYDVFVKKDGDWVTDQRVDQLTTSAIVSNLTPDTDYSFRVAAVREGTGGTGPLSYRNNTITRCSKPSASPTGLHVAAINAKELEVTWEHLPSESAECRSGVTHYMIYYASTGSTSLNALMLPNETSSYTLRGLEANLDYSIQMTASNKDEESDMSSETIGKTLEEVAPSPINVAITQSTTSSFTVSWSTPLPANINGNIHKYIIRYKRTDPAGDGNYKMEEVLTGAFDGEHTVMDLLSEINFTVQVRTVNGAGSSNWSEPVNAKTTLSGDDNGTRIPLGAVIGGVIVSLVIIVLLIYIVVIYRRIKQRRLNAEPAASPPNTAHETSSKYGNPAFDDSDTHTYQSINTDTPTYQNITDAHTYQNY